MIARDENSIPSLDVWREFDGHESVSIESDSQTGLFAVIAIHRTGKSNAAGGIRFSNYSSVDDAVRDSLRLSQAMSYKFALCDLPVGGAKSVIIAPPDGHKTQAMFAEFGRRVERLAGRYLCGPDVGTDSWDMLAIQSETSHVTGIPAQRDALAVATAKGVLHAIEAALEWTGFARIENARIGIQGLGKVGAQLAIQLAERGARLVIADFDNEKVADLARVTGAEISDPSSIHQVEADVFAPCAMGGILTAKSVGELQSSIVCGAANNQLASQEVGDMLADEGVLYVPDYLANAGGAIKACALAELRAAGTGQICGIGSIHARCTELFEMAKTMAVPTATAAGLRARSKLAELSS
jgi:leucine dehydrogenase